MPVSEGMNPRDVKFLLAQEIVARFHDDAAATQALENFVSQFQQGAIPDDITEVTLTTGADGLPIAVLIKSAGLTPSTSEAIRMIKQGAVKIDGERVDATDLLLTSGKTIILQVGKRRFKKVVLA